MIMENEIFKYFDEKGERIRVVYIDSENSKVFYVNLDINLCTPKMENLDKLEEEIKNNILVKINDPYLKSVDESKISMVEKEKRDLYWPIITKVWEDRKIELLDRRTRSTLLKEVSSSLNITVITLRRLLNRFWQRGMNKNSLLPDYKNSGGKGKERNPSDSKVGRPKKISYIEEAKEGVNVTKDLKRQFELAVNKYYRNNKKVSIMDTYNYILRDFFSDVVIKDGEKSFIVWDKLRIPTYDQFYYWFKKNEDPKKDIVLRESAKEFELKNRELLSNSTIETDGPGTRFQVDATIADIYLVSSLDRNRIIGRPVVYAIIDVFSRLVTGIYVGLEGPSWFGAMMALDNMITDKVEFCKSYGIEIVDEQWPAKHIPDIIIADRGEFEGYSVENLINNLNIKIENTPPYRGDLKGIVERSFKTTNEKIKHKTPGAIQKEYRKRGDRDYRLDATLTLEEFTKIYINLVLEHNNKQIDKYPVEIEMLKDNIAPIPSVLWNWGIENKKGRLRTVDREVLRLNVLPRGRANVSRAGIRFKGLYYGSQKALEEQWFIKSKVRSIEILYDPRNMNNIYIPYEEGKSFETCYLLDPSKQYKDCILEEIIFNFELISELKEAQKNKQNQLKVDVDLEIDKIVKAARKKKSIELNGESDNKKLKGIKINRAIEKELNREKEAFKLGKEKISAEGAEVIKLNASSKEEKAESSKDRLMDLLRKKRDEKREKR
ncbi:transposon Tn7 transposition protein TnsB [Clostridium ragsdalei P11]|uniref:Transposon Tn7 transposition protein TnsB n=1 Tax=Clostridium ragsdalei P11 TaxID=1353534 RepID=A0A1A6ASF4_9CLOT|nr:Mu transposase C-terminal domain-containing protein [Clostridium ragsdalei]OBR92965.1 transposon Tn7 transposition protein TnsB [Clostridium ragsdalei P11]